MDSSPVWLMGACAIGMSVASFVLMGLDKRAARLGNRRTSEKTLLLVSLSGGWPGTLGAMLWFRLDILPAVNDRDSYCSQTHSVPKVFKFRGPVALNPWPNHVPHLQISGVSHIGHFV
jgi:hypothetical protein